MDITRSLGQTDKGLIAYRANRFTNGRPKSKFNAFINGGLISLALFVRAMEQ